MEEREKEFYKEKISNRNPTELQRMEKDTLLFMKVMLSRRERLMEYLDDRLVLERTLEETEDRIETLLAELEVIRDLM